MSATATTGTCATSTTAAATTVLLRAGLEADRCAAGVVIRDRLALSQQCALTELASDAQAGLGDFGKDENCLCVLTQRLGRWNAGVEVFRT